MIQFLLVSSIPLFGNLLFKAMVYILKNDKRLEKPPTPPTPPWAAEQQSNKPANRNQNGANFECSRVTCWIHSHNFPNKNQRLPVQQKLCCCMSSIASQGYLGRAFSLSFKRWSHVYFRFVAIASSSLSFQAPLCSLYCNIMFLNSLKL